jgi:hypothetical protein
VIRLAERPEQSAMHVVIDASSIDTNVKMRDDHLRSADFLDVDRFPTLEFYSDRFAHRGGNRWAVTGALSLHGVTRTITLDTEYLGVGNGMEGEVRAACRAVHRTAPRRLHGELADDARPGHRRGRPEHHGQSGRTDRAQGLTGLTGPDLVFRLAARPRCRAPAAYRKIAV